MEKANKLIMNNWIESHPVITEVDLGWDEDCIRDAMSEDSREILEYFIRNSFSIIFYNVDDGNFYEFFMESEPHKFWRIPKDPNWDGKYISRQILWESHQEGEVLFEFTDDSDVWNTLKIGDRTIGEVLERSIIAEIN